MTNVFIAAMMLNQCALVSKIVGLINAHRVLISEIDQLILEVQRLESQIAKGALNIQTQPTSIFLSTGNIHCDVAILLGVFFIIACGVYYYTQINFNNSPTLPRKVETLDKSTQTDFEMNQIQDKGVGNDFSAGSSAQTGWTFNDWYCDRVLAGDPNMSLVIQGDPTTWRRYILEIAGRLYYPVQIVHGPKEPPVSKAARLFAKWVNDAAGPLILPMDEGPIEERIGRDIVNLLCREHIVKALLDEFSLEGIGVEEILASETKKNNAEKKIEELD